MGIVQLQVEDRVWGRWLLGVHLLLAETSIYQFEVVKVLDVTLVQV